MGAGASSAKGGDTLAPRPLRTEPTHTEPEVTETFKTESLARPETASASGSAMGMITESAASNFRTDAEREARPLPSGVVQKTTFGMDEVIPADWTLEDEEDEGAGEGAVAGGPAQELIHELRKSTREQGINLLQVMHGSAQRMNMQLPDFVAVLHSILGESKHGLVQRGAEELFIALDLDRTGTISCEAAADALAVDSRGNPLRSAGQSRGLTGSTRPMSPTGGTAAVHQDTAAVATGGASAAGWTQTYMKDQLELALSHLRKLAASKVVLQREGEEAQADVLHNKTRLENAKARLEKLKAENNREERPKVESEMRRAETDLDRAESRVAEKHSRRAWVEEELANVENWRRFLHLEIEQSKAADLFKYMDIDALQRTLDLKMSEMDALWKIAPRTQEELLDTVETRGDVEPPELSKTDGSNSARDTARDAESERTGRTGLKVMAEIEVLKRTVSPLQAVVALTLRAENERLRDKEADLVQRCTELAAAQELIAMLKKSKASLQAALQTSQSEAARLATELERAEAECERTAQALDAARKEGANAISSLAAEQARAAAAEAEAAVLSERLSKMSAEVGRTTKDNVTLRAENFLKTQMAAEARDLLEEVEALRKHEERTFLAVQDDKTKMQSAKLTDKVGEFRQA